MTRLQKKCLIATAGAHLLVVVAVLCSGFIRPTPKPDNTDVLDVIPANLVDAALNSGVKDAPKPAPTPPTPPQPQPVVTPPTPVTPPPAPTPPTLVHQIEKFFTPEPPPVQDNTPADIPKPKPVHKEIKLVPVVRTVSNTTDDNAAADARENARELKREQAARRKAIAAVARDIANNASSATTVEMPGTSSVSYANYASVVKSIYERSWTAPDNAASDDGNVRVSVTIRNDGTVISSQVLTPSGDSGLDESVQRTLDRVTFVAPFPEGATETERTFIINFNLKAKRMFG